jgi:hypothetical protein
MPDLITFIIYALAVYRLTQLVIYDEGPYSIFDRIRMTLRIHERNDWIGRGLTCPACVSFWIGLLLAALSARGVVNVILVGLAYSAVAYVLARKVR